MLHLTDRDRAMFDGAHGQAPQLAMSILVRMAGVYSATELMDISQAHIDSTIYLGDATLEFAERLAALGARVAVRKAAFLACGECSGDRLGPWQ